MAKSKKAKDTYVENTIEEASELSGSNFTEPETETISDGGKNIIVEPELTSVVESEAIESVKVTETEFLQRILQIQYEGGFGRHLDSIITERIKEINS